MNKKQLIATCVLLLMFLPSCVLYAADMPKVYPKELRKMKYFKKNLVSYRKTSGIEYFTFLDPKIEEKGSTITFVVENGEVISSFKGALKIDEQEQPPKQKTKENTVWPFEETRKEVEGKIKRSE